ncbi:unnamed protein product [Chrysoparadoxa australica]
MVMQGKGSNKFLISPDLRKGLVTVAKGGDQLLHFTWKDRTSNAVGDELMLFPDECVYKKVDTGKAEDRVYLLELKGSGRRLFYWMQDKDSSQDEENCSKINKVANDPASADTMAAAGAVPAAAAPGNDGLAGMLRALGNGSGADGGSGGDSGGDAQINAQDLSSILQNMGFSPQQPQQDQAPTGGSSESTTAPAPTAADSSTAAAASASTAPAATPASTGSPAITTGGTPGQLTTADLQRAMMDLATGGMQQQQPRALAALYAYAASHLCLSPGIFDDPSVVEALTPLLPESQQSEAELRETMRSPQLQQALASLTQALQSDNFNSIMSNFGLVASNPASQGAMASGDGVRALVEALIFAAEQKRYCDKRSKG